MTMLSMPPRQFQRPQQHPRGVLVMATLVIGPPNPAVLIPGNASHADLGLEREERSQTLTKERNMDIKVLGTGCANCRATIALIEQTARAKGVPITLGKIEELREIMGYGVMSTPGVVIDGKVVHAGGIPSRDKIEKWLAN